MHNIFLLLSSKALWTRIKSSYPRLFSNVKQKENNIIISRVISSHMGLIYIETPCMYKLYLALNNPPGFIWHKPVTNK